ncbi:unnamed protein product [Protopolystoma xenopodis]|uniref:Uncharacterized protein n=1 Tax=Protopolystoma xenopodis TaxID=117903 RepID=A0A3S5CNQ2_9PLAT|nr:unnamed protein product [Protopolystoma xenopodis]
MTHVKSAQRSSSVKLGLAIDNACTACCPPYRSVPSTAIRGSHRQALKAHRPREAGIDRVRQCNRPAGQPAPRQPNLRERLSAREACCSSQSVSLSLPLLGRAWRQFCLFAPAATAAETGDSCKAQHQNKDEAWLLL